MFKCVSRLWRISQTLFNKSWTTAFSYSCQKGGESSKGSVHSDRGSTHILLTYFCFKSYPLNLQVYVFKCLYGFNTLWFWCIFVSNSYLINLVYSLYILLMLFSIYCVLYQCCFCKLLGLCFMHICRLYDLYHALCSLLCFV